MNWTAESLRITIQAGQLLTTAFAVAAAIWAFRKWRMKEELVPRIHFEIDIIFVGMKDGKLISEIVATMENRGIVPIKIKRFFFVIRSLKKEDSLEFGGDEIRNQLFFKNKVIEQSFIPKSWDYTFIYPGVRTEYNHVAAFENDLDFVRVEGHFDYPNDVGSHHAARVRKVPSFGAPEGNSR